MSTVPALPPADFVIIGGGILGLATARALVQRGLGPRVVILEKEPLVAQHQTGRNSGVLHSGLYYRPGSLKARFTRQGHQAVQEFCASRVLPLRLCGKTVVAFGEGEVERLRALESRGRENGLRTEWLDAAGIRAHEPEARGDAGLWVAETGIVDFGGVARTIAAELRQQGVEILLGTRFVGVAGTTSSSLRLRTSKGEIETGFLINCAGLFSDRIARLAGVEESVRIVPFRGEYFRLRREARDLVRGLIYPVPNPQLPFLGVHLHRTIDGEVFAGPNAVPAGRREGYRRRDFAWVDVQDTVAWPGFWRLARRYGTIGVAEMVRSLSKGVFTRSLQRLVPRIRRRDLEPARAGVRAQALYRDGRLVDDFVFGQGERSLHVLNAPSPAATACFPIAEHIVDRLDGGVDTASERAV